MHHLIKAIQQLQRNAQFNPDVTNSSFATILEMFLDQVGNDWIEQVCIQAATRLPTVYPGYQVNPPQVSGNSGQFTLEDPTGTQAPISVTIYIQWGDLYNSPVNIDITVASQTETIQGTTQQTPDEIADLILNITPAVPQ